MPPDPQEWALAQSRQPGPSAPRGPDGGRGLVPLGDTTPPVGGDRRPFFARLLSAGTGGQYSFVEVQQSPSAPGTWVTVPGGVVGPASGPGGAWEPNGNVALNTDATAGTGAGAVVLLMPSSGDYGADYAVIALMTLTYNLATFNYINDTLNFLQVNTLAVGSPTVPSTLTADVGPGSTLVATGPGDFAISTATLTTEAGTSTLHAGPVEICNYQFWCCADETSWGALDAAFHDYVLPGGGKTVYNLSTANPAGTKLTGIQAADFEGSPGPQVIALFNEGGSPVPLEPDDGGSAAANQFRFPGRAVLRGGGGAILYYDTCLAGGPQWVLLALTSVFGASGPDHGIGLVPDPGAVVETGCAVRYLREDGTWVAPLAGGATTTIAQSVVTDVTWNSTTCVMTKTTKTLTINVVCGRITSITFA
jgi:hypothetical protein